MSLDAVTLEAPASQARPLEALHVALPAYARDLSLNLAALVEDPCLTDRQKWGAFVASAHAVGVGPVVKAMEEAARAGGLGEDCLTAAKAAAAIMGMNNIYYRALHLLKNPEYTTLPSRLRMNIVANPGCEKTDFELWCTAVSAVNGCGVCLDSHEEELKRRGFASIKIQTALRIAAVTHAISAVMRGEAAAG